MLLHHHLSIIIYHLYHLYYTMFNYILYYTLCKRTRQGRPLRCSQSHFIIIGCHSFDGIYWFSPCHLIIIVNIVITNIATGETSQAITPFHFFNCSNFFGFYHYITSSFHHYKLDNFFSLDNFSHMITFSH